MTIDLTKEKPFHINGNVHWYRDHVTQDFVTTKNDFNLPALKGLHCFVVINEKENISDYVMVNDNREIICAYKFPNEQHEYETKIKMFKIVEYYNQHESNI